MIKIYKQLSNSYVAGLFDGEGCVGVALKKGKTNLRYRLTICNQHKKVLLAVKQKFKGHIYKNSNPNECWIWEISSKKEAENFLRKTLPHLVIKKQRATIALKAIMNTYIVPQKGRKIELKMQEMISRINNSHKRIMIIKLKNGRQAQNTYMKLLYHQQQKNITPDKTISHLKELPTKIVIYDKEAKQ